MGWERVKIGNDHIVDEGGDGAWMGIDWEMTDVEREIVMSWLIVLEMVWYLG